MEPQVDERSDETGEDEATILAIDNVRLELPVAGIGGRALAAFLDHIVLMVALMLLILAMLAIMTASGTSGSWMAVVLLATGLFVNWFYFAVLEVALEGQTPGKKALKLRVVASNGGSASRGALLLRNLVRPLDYLVGVLLIASDPRARRLGDRLAGTLVVREPGQSSELVLGRLPASWGPRHVAVVEAFCERSQTLRPEESGHLARRILALIRRDDPALAAEIDEDDDPVVAVRKILQVSML